MDTDAPDDLAEAFFGLRNVVVQSLGIALSWYHYAYNEDNAAETEMWSLTYEVLSVLNTFSFVLSVITTVYFVAAACEISKFQKRRAKMDSLVLVNVGFGVSLDSVYLAQLLLEATHQVDGLFPSQWMAAMILLLVVRIILNLMRQPKVA